ncbi:hypothetical protein ABW20_dc0108738 [Dactylellina cionopaga]|nr:hypothetical protein ABW20_dc0108738 [Dactylellina cionopaga]
MPCAGPYIADRMYFTPTFDASPDLKYLCRSGWDTYTATQILRLYPNPDTWFINTPKFWCHEEQYLLDLREKDLFIARQISYRKAEMDRVRRHAAFCSPTPPPPRQMSVFESALLVISAPVWVPVAVGVNAYFRIQEMWNEED